MANLLTNAAKYTPDSGRIRIRAARLPAAVRLEVIDNGIGIDPSLLPRLFELFVQGPRTIDRTQGGLGLGLAIVRAITELHDGRIEAHSAGPGAGSRFVIELPLAVVGQPQPALLDEPGPSPDVPMPPRVLVVDDNQDAAETLGEVLTLVGWDVRVAHDGPGALALAPTFRPQLALLDIGLPVMDGYELGRQLAALLPGVKLVAVTGYGVESDRMRSQAAGFAVHLVKPVELEQLTAVVDGLLKAGPS